MRTHTGEKPFECALCDFKSSHLGSLHSHLKVHEGVRPYKCDHCDFTAAYHCHLKSHLAKCLRMQITSSKRRRKRLLKDGTSVGQTVTKQPSYTRISGNNQTVESKVLSTAATVSTNQFASTKAGDITTEVFCGVSNPTATSSPDLNMCYELSADGNLQSSAVEVGTRMKFNASSADFSNTEVEPNIYICIKCNYITLAYQDLLQHKMHHNSELS